MQLCAVWGDSVSLRCARAGIGAKRVVPPDWFAQAVGAGGPAYLGPGGAVRFAKMDYFSLHSRALDASDEWPCLSQVTSVTVSDLKLRASTSGPCDVMGILLDG